jgi:hypothetical protein
MGVTGLKVEVPSLGSGLRHEAEDIPAPKAQLPAWQALGDQPLLADVAVKSGPGNAKQFAGFGGRDDAIRVRRGRRSLL